MQKKQPATPVPAKNKATEDPDLYDAIRNYVRAHQRRHGQKHTAGTLGVSRHTLWRYLERGHVGRAVPAAVLNHFDGESVQDIEAATVEMVVDLEDLRPDPAQRPLHPGAGAGAAAAVRRSPDNGGRVGPLRADSRIHAAGTAGEVNGARPGRLRVPPPVRPGLPSSAPLLSHGEGRRRRRHVHPGSAAHAGDLPAVQAVVPAAGRKAGRRGGALPRRRHDRRRRPAPGPRAGGPPPPRPLQPAAHAVRGAAASASSAREQRYPAPTCATASAAPGICPAARGPSSPWC